MSFIPFFVPIHCVVLNVLHRSTTTTTDLGLIATTVTPTTATTYDATETDSGIVTETSYTPTVTEIAVTTIIPTDTIFISTEILTETSITTITTDLPVKARRSASPKWAN